MLKFDKLHLNPQTSRPNIGVIGGISLYDVFRNGSITNPSKTRNNIVASEKAEDVLLDTVSLPDQIFLSELCSTISTTISLTVAVDFIVDNHTIRQHRHV